MLYRFADSSQGVFTCMSYRFADSSQGFFTVHTAMVYVIQVC